MLPGAAASPGPTGRDDGTGQPPQAASLQQGVASAADQEALLARCKLIFLNDSVRASGLGAVVSPSTLRAILAAELAANALWKTHEAQVRQCFAPELVAKQEVFGYLLNDMAGKQLLHSDYAMPVGQRGDNAVAKAKSQLKLKSAAACLATSKPAAATVLASTYDLKLPNVTVGGIAPRQRPQLTTAQVQVQSKLDIAIATHDGLVARMHRAGAAMWTPQIVIDGRIVDERAWYAARENFDAAYAQMKAAGVNAMAMCNEASKTAQEAVRVASPGPNPNPHPNPNPNQCDESGDEDGEEAWDDKSPGWTRCVHCRGVQQAQAGKRKIAAL